MSTGERRYEASFLTKALQCHSACTLVWSFETLAGICIILSRVHKVCDLKYFMQFVSFCGAACTHAFLDRPLLNMLAAEWTALLHVRTFAYVLCGELALREGTYCSVHVWARTGVSILTGTCIGRDYVLTGDWAPPSSRYRTAHSWQFSCVRTSYASHPK